jgi:Zn-ribbon protein, possibly nucleic acid-binding
MAKKKVTEEEVSTPVEETAVKTKTTTTKKVTPKKTVAKSSTTKKSTKKADEKSVVENPEVVETTTVENEEITAVEKSIEGEVDVETTQNGIIELKKHVQDSDHSEEITIEQKLLSLYHLQQICSKIDEIRVIRGELPEEIRDKEDECEGKRTRISKFNDEINILNQKISDENRNKEEASALIEKYQEQQNHVRNNREYESLNKEIEYQQLEILGADKNKGKFEAEIANKKELISETEAKLAELEETLAQKKAELDVIVESTQKEEAELLEKAEVLKASVDERLLTAFERIRKNARNGLAIVKIERDACGGCFSKIPPQRQLDIALHKKIIVCEACGRIFIDDKLVRREKDQEQAGE